MNELKLLKPQEVAEILSVTVATLARWRWLGLGPSYVKLPSAVRYNAQNLRSWIDSQGRTSTRVEMSSQRPESAMS